jgi:hypothetical protein
MIVIKGPKRQPNSCLITQRKNIDGSIHAFSSTEPSLFIACVSSSAILWVNKSPETKKEMGTSLFLIDISLSLFGADRTKDDVHLFKTSTLRFRNETEMDQLVRTYRMKEKAKDSTNIENKPIAPILTVANIRKSLYPRSVIISGVTLVTTKSIEIVYGVIRQK